MGKNKASYDDEDDDFSLAKYMSAPTTTTTNTTTNLNNTSDHMKDENDDDDDFPESKPLSDNEKVNIMRQQMGLQPIDSSVQQQQSQQQQGEHQYTQQEIRSLQETQNLFQSSLFRIAVCVLQQYCFQNLIFFCVYVKNGKRERRFLIQLFVLILVYRSVETSGYSMGEEQEH